MVDLKEIFGLDRNQALGLWILVAFVTITVLTGLLAVLGVFDCCPPDLIQPGT